MHFSKEEKARILERWRQSGKSISAYVKENGLIRWTFTKWLKAEREEKPCFVEVPAQVLQPPLQMAEIVIEKGDIKIHVPLGIGREGLRSVMEGLGALV